MSSFSRLIHMHKLDSYGKKCGSDLSMFNCLDFILEKIQMHVVFPII
jgi:hypothetical protein